MERDPKTWIIIKEAYLNETTALNYTLENVTPGSYEVNSGNTLTIPATTGIVEGDTVVLDMTNIKSYEGALNYLQTITAKIDVVLFMGADDCGKEFSLTENANILSFSIRQKKDTVTNDNSGNLVLSNNNNLTVIDINRFKLIELTISNCTNCESISIINAGSANIYIGGGNNDNFVLDNFSKLKSLTIINYIIDSISISSTNEDHPLETLDLRSSTCQTLSLPFDTFMNIQNILLTNCTNLRKFNNKEQDKFIAVNIKNLKEVNLLNTPFTNIDVNNSSNIKSIYIPSSVTTINLNGCKSFSGFNNETGITNLPSIITELYLSDTNVKSIDLNSTNASLSKLTPPESVESISIPGISLLTGFYINNELTNNITSLTSLQSLNISGTGITSLVGEYEAEEEEEGEEEKEEIKMIITATHETFTTLILKNRIIDTMTFNENGFSTINCISCSFPNNCDLSMYNTLTSITLTNCTLNKFTLNTTVTDLNISGSSFTGSFITSELTKNTTIDITTLTSLKSLNISDTSIESLIGKYRSEVEFVMKIYATHNGFKSLALEKRIIDTMSFNENGFSTIICDSCGFPNGCDLSGYNVLTYISLTNCDLNMFKINTSVVDLDISGNPLNAFYIGNDEPTTNISSLTKLNSLSIRDTSFPKLIGNGTEGQVLSTVDAVGTSDIQLTNYSKLSSLTFSTISNLNISGCSSIRGEFTIAYIMETVSINISGTSITHLLITPETVGSSITDLTLSESTSELTLGNVNYQDNFSVPDYLKSLNLTNCGIQTVSSENKHTDEFSLNVDGGNFKSFDITNFDKILNLQVGGPDTNTFNFIEDGETVTGLSGSKWSNTKIFNISGVSLSNLHIDLKDNDNQISNFNVTPSNLEALSINGWNPNPNKNSIDFSTDKLQALSLTNSEVNITLPTEFKNMPELRALDISGSPFTTLNFEYDSPNTKLASIKAESCESLESISLKNANALSELNLKDCTAFDGFIINGESTSNISSLTSLQTINVSNTNLESLVGNYKSGGDFEMNIKATHNGFKSLTLENRAVAIDFNKNGFTTINCNNCTFSDTFDLSVYNNLTSITLTSCGLGELKIKENVVTLNVSDNPLVGFNINGESTTDLSSLTSLQTLNISGAQFNSLGLNYNSSNNTLTSIIATSSLLESISLANTDELTTLHLDETSIKTLDYSGTSENPKKLKEILLPNSLTSLTLAYCTSLTSQIDPSAMTALTTFKIPNCKQKGEMYFYSESLSDVDLSNNEISFVKLSGTITSLNLENNPISGDFSYSTDPQYYGMNTSSLSTLKLAGTNITNVYIPAGNYDQGKTMGEITTLSLPSNCSYLNISSQNKIQDLSAILGSCENLNTLNANYCNLSGELEIESPLSTISLQGNSDLSTFDLSKYDSLTSFDLFGTSIANININSTGTIANAIYPVTTENITFTKAIFDESLKTPTFSGTNLPDLKTLYLANTNITSLTCSSCPALKYIILARINRQTRESTVNNSLTSLTATNCKELQTLQVYDYAILTNLDLAGCSKFYGTTDENGELVSFAESTPYLEELNISGTAVLNIDCNGITSLESLVLPSSSQNIDVSGCSNLPNLDISNCENLEQLDAHESGISSLTTSSAKQATLTEINMSSTSIPSIDLANYTSLQTIDCNGITSLKSLSLPSSSQNIDVSGCSNLPNLDISNCENLEQLDAHESGISSIKTSTNEQTGLTSIANYTSLQTIDLSKTKITDLEISNLETLTKLKLDNNNLSTFSIDGCKELENNYLQNLTITDSATFKNLGSFVPQGISTIAPSSLTITETDWNSFSLNGALLNNSGNSITIKLNNNLESLSFDSKPDSPTYKNLDISYNIKLESINKTTNILDICRLLNANLIKFNDIENYDELNINLVMNAFTADDKTELPQYLGIWPQITDSGDNSGKLLGEINFTAAAAGKEVTGEFIGLHEETEEIENLLQYSFNNITVWDVGKYETSEDLSKLSFGPILSLYVADVDGNVPDGPIDISVNGEDRELFDIIGSMFDDETKNKPEIIYTNSNRLKTLAKTKGIPVQILHTSTENWNPGYPYPNVFKIYFIMDNL